MSWSLREEFSASTGSMWWARSEHCNCLCADQSLFNLTGPFSSSLASFLFELNLILSSKALLMWTYCTRRAGLGGGFIRIANLPLVLQQSTCSQWLSTVSQLTLITTCGSRPHSERKDIRTIYSHTLNPETLSSSQQPASNHPPHKHYHPLLFN